MLKEIETFEKFLASEVHRGPWHIGTWHGVWLGRRPAAIFYPFGHPTRSAYATGATGPTLTNKFES
jgi:hypothetical protein